MELHGIRDPFNIDEEYKEKKKEERFYFLNRRRNVISLELYNTSTDIYWNKRKKEHLKKQILA